MLRALGPACRKILTKLENPGQWPFETLVEKMEKCIEQEAQIESSNQIPLITEMIMYHSQAAGQKLTHYWEDIKALTPSVNFDGRVAVLAGACHKSSKMLIRWSLIKDETTLKIQLNNVDNEKEANSLKSTKSKPLIKSVKQYKSMKKVMTKKNYNVINEESLINEFPEIVDSSFKNLGYEGEVCNIDTEEGKVIQAKQGSIKRCLQEQVEKEIANLKEKEYIRLSRSSWNNPINP